MQVGRKRQRQEGSVIGRPSKATRRDEGDWASAEGSPPLCRPSPGAVERAVKRLRRGKVPPGDRGRLLLSYCSRNGLKPKASHIAALAAPPAAAIEAAEAAGVVLTLAELAGPVPQPQFLWACKNRRWMIDNADRVKTHCREISAADSDATFAEDSHKFLRAVGAKLTIEEAAACVGDSTWKFMDIAPLVSGIDIEAVRRFYRNRTCVPAHVSRVIVAAGLELTADGLAYACGQDGPWSVSLIEAVLAKGLEVDVERALSLAWPPRLLWRLFSRDAHLPGVQAAFYRVSYLPFFGIREWESEWLGCRRCVVVLQRAFRRALRSRAARKIQSEWRRATSDPARGVGRRRLFRMFREALSDDA